MKRSHLFFTSLFALTIAISGCTFVEKVVQEVNVEVNQAVRKTGDFFSLDDVNVYFTYKSGKELIERSNSLYNNLKILLKCPEQGVVTLKADNYVLPDIGTYNVEVTYNPNSNYLFPVTGTASFDVLDRIVPATSLSLGSDSLSVSAENSEKIDYLLQPLDSTSIVSFESSDTSVASVSNDGIVTGVGEGQCIVSVFAEGFKQECLVTVSPSQKVDYVFSNSRFESQKGNWTFSIPGNKKLMNGVSVVSETTIISPISYANITRIAYKISNTRTNEEDTVDAEISTYIGSELIDECTIKSSNEEIIPSYEIGNKSGYVSLKIKPNTDNGSDITIDSITINYNGEPIYPTSISLKEGISIPINSKDKVTISYSPKATNQRFIEWSSSDESILTVGRDGTVFGKKEGNAIVTAKAKTEDGEISASALVRIFKVIVRSIELENEEITLYEKSSKEIKYRVMPVEASYKEVMFRSSNTKVATVDDDGIVTGIKPGQCEILIRSIDEFNITVLQKVVVLEKPALAANQMSYSFNDFADKTYAKRDASPSIGKTKFLVIPVWFKNSSEFISSRDLVRDDIEKSFFGDKDDTGWESVKTYYETESNQRLYINGIVSDWYEINYKHSDFDYYLDIGPKNNSKTIYDLVTDATNWYFNSHSDNRKNYDFDSYGYLDGVILIYGCPDRSAYAMQEVSNKGSYGEHGDTLWAFTGWLGNNTICDVNKPAANCFLWASYDFMYSEKDASSRTGKSSYASGNTKTCVLDTHTYIHEVGHIFGLDDYYDYSNKYNPAGGFSMQDHNVGGHDPFSCLALGWADAYVPYEDCQITLYPFQSSHQLILLSPSFNMSNSPFDEYLLLELYAPTGLNKHDTQYQYKESTAKGVDETGIRLWHVDARLVEVKNNSNYANSFKTHTIPFNNNALMMSNTYLSNSSYAYISPCGNEYTDFNLLQLIRNNPKETYRPKNDFAKTDLFINGSTFDMETYKKQFVFNGKLNSGVTLDWSFSVSIKGNNENAVATISLDKN